MQIAVAISAILFVYLSGRNDGGPLLSFPLQFQRSQVWVPLFILYLSVPAVVLLGINRVALDLEKLAAPATHAAGSGAPTLVLLLAVLFTLAFSAFLNAPTSITLALIGSLAGTALGTGGDVPWRPLVRIVSLGVAAPLVSMGLAFLIRKVQQNLPLRRFNARRRVGLLRAGYFFLLSAYATNDGQKIIFATALALGVGVDDATRRIWWVLLAALIFTLGALHGADRSGKFIRHGIARSSAGALTTSEFAAGISVFAGSFLGAPLSATQSISGGLAGTAFAISSRNVYWNGLRRVAATWVWTLPLATLVAYLLSLVSVAILG